MDDDIELGEFSKERIVQGSSDAGCFQERKIPTNFGTFTISVSPNFSAKKHVMLTYHDIGQNADTCFQSFFQFSDMAALTEHFAIVHVSALGQEEDAEPMDDTFIYPTMEDLADMIDLVVDELQIKHFIGFGVGAGAHILCRYALIHPNVIDGLILINCSVTQAGWLEWIYHRVSDSYLWKRGMTTFTLDMLMWHHFGRRYNDSDMEIVREYWHYFLRWKNPKNLAFFIDSYIRRTDLGLLRDDTTLACPVLLLVGAESPHINTTIDTVGRLDTAKTEWVKVSDCLGLILDEKPDKATESILLFLQGQGYLTNISHLKWVQRKQSMEIPDLRSSQLKLKCDAEEVPREVKT